MPLYLLLFSKALSTVVACLYPIIGLVLVVTVITAIIQAALQLEDVALSLLPKTVAVIFLILASGLGLLHGIHELMEFWIGHVDRLIRLPWS
jgi:flagellar biosynthesis protein FliQ